MRNTKKTIFADFRMMNYGFAFSVENVKDTCTLEFHLVVRSKNCEKRILRRIRISTEIGLTQNTTLRRLLRYYDLVLLLSFRV